MTGAACASPPVSGIPARLPCPSSPNCVSCFDSPTDSQHYIAPLSYTASTEVAQDQLKAILLALPRSTLIYETPGYIHITVTSKIFRFVDDVEAWIDHGAIELKSASRVGYGDLGVNRNRINSIVSAWQAQRL
jgi:uncharacterized protein (DUF1499 family)